MNAKRRVAVSLVCIFALAGCASVSSKRVSVNQLSPVEGLGYWLPTRDLQATFTVESNGDRSLSLERSQAYGDLAAGRFVARFEPSYLADSDMKLGVNEKGLLSSAKTVTTSKVKDILSNIAKAAGYGFALDVAPRSRGNCDETGTYKSVLRLNDLKRDGGVSWCGHSFRARLLTNGTSAVQTANFSEDIAEQGRSAAGFYYRQELPYIITVVGDESVDVVMAFPNEAPTDFLPLSGTVFSKHTSNVVFSDGSPTTYDQALGSEVLAVAEIPAAVLAAYFEAIGSMFSQLSTNASNESQYLSAIATLAAQNRATEACLAAIASGDSNKISEACPGS